MTTQTWLPGMAPESKAYIGYLNAGPVHSHLRNLEKKINNTSLYSYTFENAAVGRAYCVAAFYLDELQGEYFEEQYEKAWRRGEL